MNILIDFTQIPLHRTGVGIYADNLVKQLPQLLRSGDCLFVLLQDDDRETIASLKNLPAVRTLTVPARWLRRRALLLLFEQFVLPLFLFRHRVDVLHSLHYTHPLLTRSAVVVTIHDVTHSLFPELHTRGRRLLFPFFIRHALRHAACSIFVSESTRKDAERLFGSCRKQGRVVPLAVSSGQSFTTPAAREEVLTGMRVSPPFVLFIGTFEPRKNIRRLVEAYAGVADAYPVQLVLAGKLGWDYEDVLRVIEESPHRERIRHLGYISELQKEVLLQKCSVLVYPSLYEGFGLPVLEAMAAGAPVVTSNVSSLPEVAGTAAILVDPTSVKAIAAAIREILVNPQRAEAMRQAGRVQAEKFSWERTAKATYEVYAEAARNV